MTTLFVDADACPVKDEVVRVAERYGVSVVMVSNGGIRPSRAALVTTVVVGKGPDAADLWIAEHIDAGDVCVTSDIVLADRCIKAGARALRPNGDPFTEGNIGETLAMRDLMADLRASDPFGVGGGQRPFQKADRSRFLQNLDRMLRNVREGGSTGGAEGGGAAGGGSAPPASG